MTDAIGLDPSEIEALDTTTDVWIDMVGALVISTMLNGFLAGPYSPFYTDAAHPSFVERSASLIEAVLEDEVLPEVLRGHFEFFRAFLLRQAEAPNSLVAEISFREPLINVGFTSSSILATSDLGRQISDISLSDTQPTSKSSTVNLLFPSLNPGPDPKETTELTWPSRWIIAKSEVYWPVLSDEEYLLIVDADADKSWHYVGKNWVPAKPFEIETNKCFDIWTGPEPSRHAFALNCPTEFDTMLYGLEDGTVKARRTEKNLLADLRSKLADPSVELALLKSDARQPAVFVNEDLVALDLHAKDSETGLEFHRAVATLDLATLKVVQVIDLSNSQDMLSLSDRTQVLAKPRRDGKDVVADVFLMTDLADVNSGSWGIWRYTAEQTFNLIAESSFLLSTEMQNFSTTLGSDFEPKFVQGLFFGDCKLLVNFEGDSTYVVDLSSGKVEVLFALGGITHSFAVGSSGYVALFLRGAGKLYIFKP